MWLNWFSIKKNCYFLPLISRLLNQLNHAKVYTNIDLCGAHNLVSIWEGDEWKMTFRIHYGHFQYVVMLFGSTNALIVFQHMMNDVFHEYLDNFVVCYSDGILIFSNNMANHERHVHLVLEKLQKVGFYAKLEKCGFHQLEVKFLGYIIYGSGVCMDFHKVQTIVDWATLASIRDVQYFLGFLNFYFAIHYTLFHNSDPSYSNDLGGSTFFQGKWS